MDQPPGDQQAQGQTPEEQAQQQPEPQQPADFAPPPPPPVSGMYGPPGEQPPGQQPPFGAQPAPGPQPPPSQPWGGYPPAAGQQPYPGGGYQQPPYGGQQQSGGQQWGYQQPPSAYSYGSPAGYGSMAPPNDSSAVWSLVLGILGIFCCGIVLGPIAFFLGQSSIGRIRQSGGALGGEGLANGGRITGAIATLLWIVIPVIWIVGVVASSRGG